MKDETFIVLTIIIKEKNNVWTAECKELQTVTFADTYQEVKKEIHKAIELQLETLHKTSELESFLAKYKNRIYRRKPLHFFSEILEHIFYFFKSMIKFT